MQKENCSTNIDQVSILNEVKLFYLNLYQRREHVHADDFYYKLNQFISIIKLTKEKSDSLEDPINKAKVYSFYQK